MTNLETPDLNSTMPQVDTPASVSPSDDLESTDIIVYSFSGSGDSMARQTISTRAELRSFINTSQEITQGSRDNEIGAPFTNRYIFFLQDISDAAVDDLHTELGFTVSAAEAHFKGRIKSEYSPRTENLLHAEKLSSNLLERISEKKDWVSVCWWRLSSQSREGNAKELEAFAECKADNAKVVVPLLPNVYLQRSAETQQGHIPLKWNDLVEWNFWKAATEEANTRDEITFKLGCHTYRPHHVITEVREGVWGSASEEKVTFLELEAAGNKYLFFLFDKERTLHQHDRRLQIKKMKFSLSEPIASIIHEETGPPMHTFLRSTSNPDVDTTTRSRFITQVVPSELLRHQATSVEDSQTMSMIKLGIIKIIAHDWNLLLSQMRETLDDIDAKISDNHELRRNVPAWRNLLCTWRVTIIGYSFQLEETVKFIKSQATPQGSTPSTSTLDQARSSQQGPQSENTSSPSTSRGVTGFINDELDTLLAMYKILMDDTKAVEERADRSFHALMSSMTIAESERAIVQGSAVVRLTELAFVFIPLNFATSFFSMQVTNFSGPGQPGIGAFFGLAIGLIVTLYSLRAVIRSRALLQLKKNLGTKIRQSRQVPPGSRISTQVILEYGWQQLNLYLILALVFVIILSLVLGLSQEKGFKIAVSVIMALGAVPATGFYWLGYHLLSICSAVTVAWLLTIFSITLEAGHLSNIGAKATLCTLLTTCYFVVLAIISGTFKDPVRYVFRLSLPLWILELPVFIIYHYYHISHPHWEPWKFTIGFQGVFIFFGFIAFVFKMDWYCGIPELAALIAVTIGIPSSIVWQYLPLRGDPIPQYAVICITFGCIILFRVSVKRIRRFRNIAESPVGAIQGWAMFTQTCSSIGISIGSPVSLAWAYYPTYGRHYSPERLSQFPGKPIKLWIQISITFASIVLYAIFIAIDAVKYRDSTSLVFAWLLSGLALATWLPILLWYDNIGIFAALTRSRSNTFHVTWTSVLFWIIAWSILFVFYRKCVWRKQHRLREESRILSENQGPTYRSAPPAETSAILA